MNKKDCRLTEATIGRKALYILRELPNELLLLSGCENTAGVAACIDYIKTDLADLQGEQYLYKMGPYTVELGEDQWRKVLGAFERANMGDEHHFVCLDEHLRGLVADILIELGLAPSEGL